MGCSGSGGGVIRGIADLAVESCRRWLKEGCKEMEGVSGRSSCDPLDGEAAAMQQSGARQPTGRRSKGRGRVQARTWSERLNGRLGESARRFAVTPS